MSHSGTSLITLLGLSSNEDFHQKVLTMGVDAEQLSSLKGRMTKLLKGLQWKAIEGDIRKKTLELLDMDAMELMKASWDKYKVLAEFAEKSESEGKAVHVPLTEHAITAELHPYLEIQVGELTEKIIFDVSVEFKLKGLILRIDNGRITEVEAGSCEGSGKIAIKEQSLLHREFGPFELHGKVSLGSGIRVI